LDMPTLTLGEARSDDVPAMVDLLGQLFSLEQDFEPDAVRQSSALESILAQPHVGRLFVAASGGRVVGMASLLFTISTATGGRAAWLEDLVVDRSFRGRGLGGALLDHVVAWARGHGVTRLTLLTDRENESAQRLYTRRGFAVSHMIPLRLPLLSDP